MGRFFSLVQIKNNGSREQFLKAFCDVMKKRSLVPCSEKESSVSQTGQGRRQTDSCGNENKQFQHGCCRQRLDVY